jgi:hypothetical protein
MLLLTNSYYDRLEERLISASDTILERAWPVLDAFINSETPKQEQAKEPEKEVAAPIAESREAVQTTHRGVRVVANKEEVCFYGSSEMIRAEWMDVPGIFACLRGALVPYPKESEVNEAQAEAALDLASGFGQLEKNLFTIGDAEDITGGCNSILSKCPDTEIAAEISRINRLGPRKLFRYIETEIISE